MNFHTNGYKIYGVLLNNKANLLALYTVSILDFIGFLLFSVQRSVYNLIYRCRSNPLQFQRGIAQRFSIPL